MSSTVGPPQSPAKQRALRIPLDYYKRWTALDRAKWLLAALATLIGGAYAGWLVAGYRSGVAARQFSPGHVTLAHAAWNDRCEACHTLGTPLNPHAGGSDSLRQWLTGGTKPARLLNEQKCVACHPAATHHPRQIAGQVETCAACHHDHAGIDADLKQVASERCIACHADIAGHSTLATATPATATPATATLATATPAVNVASWATHPDFRSLDSGDPGRVKFNHRLHLLPGQYPRDAKPSALKRLGAIDKSYWNLLGYAQDASPDTVVQLDCSACHEFEETSGRLASTSLTTGSPESAPKRKGEPSGASSSLVVGSMPASGAYALPIRYERHCASCHDTDLAATVEGPRRAVRASIPHGSSPGTIRGLLRGAYLAAESDARTAKEGGAAHGSPAVGSPVDGPLVPRRAVPGRSLRSDDAGQSTGTSLDAIPAAARVRQAELQLATESHCGKCHPFPRADSMPGAARVAVATDGELDSELLAVAPAQIPAIWLSKGGFDHAAHRALRCDACHESSSFEWSAGGKPPIDDAKPKIPRIDNCRQCHGDSPAETKASVSVRADCVTCHRYHAADEPPHGHGSPTHTPPPARRISTREWLDGRFYRSELAEGIAP